MISNIEKLRAAIVDVPDYPKKGIVFKDITPLFNQATLFQELIHELSQPLQGLDFTTIVAVESRGFILGSALAYSLKKNLVLVRKKNKLPRDRFSQTYDLEYGTDVLEMHKGDLAAGQKAIIVDDVLATGGTAKAVEILVQLSGASLAAHLFLIELGFLQGSGKLSVPVHSLIRY